MQIDASNLITQSRAPLIRLTLIPFPELNGGEPTATYVDPAAISAIKRVFSSPKDQPDAEGIECTLIQCCHYTMIVMESPEVIAMLRDRALGAIQPYQLTQVK